MAYLVKRIRYRCALTASVHQYVACSVTSCNECRRNIEIPSIISLRKTDALHKVQRTIFIRVAYRRIKSPRKSLPRHPVYLLEITRVLEITVVEPETSYYALPSPTTSFPVMTISDFSPWMITNTGFVD